MAAIQRARATQMRTGTRGRRRVEWSQARQHRTAEL